MNEVNTQLPELRAAFDTLNRSTEKLRSAYEKLKQETTRLDGDLTQSKSFLGDILDSLNCGVVVTSPDGQVELSNPEARRLCGDIQGMAAKWRGEAMNPDDSQELARPRFALKEDDGRELSVRVSALQRRDKEVAGLIFIIEDVTEIARLRKQAHRSDRLAAIGAMAAGMAHEIRNPLGGMEIFASLLRRELEDEPEKLRLLQHVSTGVQSINNVISNFLMFTKEPKPVKKKFDLCALVLETMEFAGFALMQSRIKVNLDMPESPVELTADRGMARQVMLNMVHNAIGALPGGGVFEVSVKAVPEQAVLPGRDDAGKGRVEIVFRDNGPGVAEEIREKIFDPFFTTKNTGAGLGLSIVSQIARAHNGYVDLLEPEEGSGAVFIVSLPTGE